jgi:hypothetical protein
MNGTTLVAECQNYFGNFQKTSLPNAADCATPFKTVNGALLPRSIQDVDGNLRCVIAFTPQTGARAPGSDFISLLSDQTVNGREIKIWRIDRPTVWSSNPDGRVDYPIITFQPGDRLRFFAGGCVQTGGRGKTWKSYLNPQGDNAPQYYAGTAFIKNVTGGSFERLQGLVTQQSNLAKQQTNLPPELRGTLGPLPKDPNAKTDYILRLGYQDDQMDDNSYFAHDDGNDDQCKNIGPAFLELTVISSPEAAAGPLLSPHFKPFDLVWDMNNDEDQNGLALNPQWNFALQNNGKQPHLKPICGPAFPSVFGWNFPINFTKLEQICTSMPVSFDLDPKGAICDGDPFPGHMNFGIATYQGEVTWDEWSGHWPNDNDWNFRLLPPNGAGLAGLGDVDADATTMGVEFDFADTNLHMPFWKDLVKSDFGGEPIDAIGSRFGGPDGLEGVVIAEVGLDGVHGGYVELHPVFAMAVRTVQTVIQGKLPGEPDTVVETWAFFLRNFGDEGGCSAQTWHWESPSGDFFVPLAWPNGATDVTPDASEVAAWQGGNPPVDIEKDPDNHFTLIHVRSPNGDNEFGVGGTVIVQYRVPGGFQKKAPPLHHAVPRRSVAEVEIKDLSTRIADPAVKAKYVAAVQALAPALRPRSAAMVQVTVPKTINVRKRTPGAASHGQMVRAKAVLNQAKLQRDVEMFKILQTYQKDLKLEVPAELPTALTPAGAQVRTK